jgi:2-polyprenyl-6-methoxyphenol hydroxylase-like FAD-dependent oxidoreductase
MAERLQTRCVIAGGGPAGIMAGYLLARAGVPVIVLEKHADFFRDFRGDTIHPSTIELMYELGLLDEFLKQPHQEVRELRAVINGQTVPIADFTKLSTHSKFIAFMPQWDFLTFLSTHAKKFPCFQLLMEHEVVDLTFDQQRVTGVRAKSPQGELEIRADLIIGADGRHSIIQARAGLERQEFGVAIDVLWMGISKKEDDPKQSLGFFQQGKLLVLLDRGDYWQCGFVIPKGGFEDIKARGLPQLQNDIVSFAEFLRDRVL